jgi:ribosomal protein L24E
MLRTDEKILIFQTSEAKVTLKQGRQPRRQVANTHL